MKNPDLKIFAERLFKITEGCTSIGKFGECETVKFNFSNIYYGEIAKIQNIKNEKEFTKKISIENIIKNIPSEKKSKNTLVCKVCQKIKLYSNIYLMTLYGTIKELLDATIKKDIVLMTFCKHEDIVGFLDVDFNLHFSDSDSSSYN